jgi:ribosome-binding protein aMBF1 (putative translation factor)
MNKKIKLISFDKILKERLKDPKFRREWERQQPEFEVIRKIIEARINKKLTQKQLAKKLKTTQSAISRIETGSGNPTLSFLQRLADVLGAKLEIKFT